MNPNESTPEKETLQTPANKEEIKEEKTYTKAEHTEKIRKEVDKVTAKWSSDLEKVKAELEAERRKALPDPEKVKAEIADRDKAIADANAKLAALEAKEKKRAALDALKLSLPADVTLQDLLEMMPDNTDEGIAASVARFQKMFPESKGLGTGTQTGQPKKEPTLQEELAAEQAKGDKADAMKLIQLRGLIAGETKK